MRRHIFRISLVMLLGVVTSVAVAWGCAWRFGTELRTTTSWDTLNVRQILPEVTRDPGQRMWSLYSLHLAGASLIKSEIIEVIEWNDDALMFYVHADAPGWTTAAKRSATDAKMIPVFELIIPRRMEGPVLRTSASPYYTKSVTEFAAGWPFLGFSCRYPVRGTGIRPGITPVDYELGLVGGFSTGDWSSCERQWTVPPTVYPYHPLWPGLLANTAIYGGVWWVMLFGPGMLIRWRRRCAGRCAKCGYDLRGNESNACPECGADDDHRPEGAVGL